MPSLAFNDVVLLDQQIANEAFVEGSYSNLLAHLNAIVGTTSKLEVQNKNQSNSASSWSTLENFTANFIYDFLHSFKEDKESINIMIGNYSDKSHIIGKLFKKNISINNKYIIGDDTADIENIMDTKEILDLFKQQSFNYYSDLIFLELFPVYKNFGVKIDYSNFNKSIKNINDFLKEFKSKNDLFTYLRANFTKGIDVVEELHYTTYLDEAGNPRLALNQVIIDFYNIFSNNTLFDQFVQNQRKSLINKLKNLKNNNNLFTPTDLKSLNIKNILKSLGIEASKYTTFEESHQIESVSGIINPILDK
jgi:hypothetical protein